MELAGVNLIGLADMAISRAGGGWGPPAAAAGLPAWVSSISVGAWAQISGTNLSSVEPGSPPPGSTGPSSKIGAWTSLVVDESTSTVYQIAGGGHGDYSGNEADALALNVETPAWANVLAPSATVTNGNYYADGKPSARHHYYGVVWNSADSKIMLPSGSRYSDGGITDKLDAYSISGNAYAAAGTHPDRPASLASQEVTPVCRDPRNDNIYVFGNFNVAKWTRSTNTWSSPISNQSAPAPNGPSAFDSTRNVIALLRTTTVIEEYAPDSNAFTSRTLTGASLPSVNEAAMVYVPALDAYLVRYSGSGGAVYKINASTWVVSDYGATGGGSVPASTPGPFNKFLYVPTLGGCVYVPSYTGNAWFLRTE